MKKTTFVLASGLIASSAFAADQVTLYGVVDLGLTYQRVESGSYKHSRIGMIPGGQNLSRWGLRGTEDIGDGTRVNFTLESGFDATAGTSGQGGRLFGRRATVGVTNELWGELSLGRQANIASQYFTPLDPFEAGFTSAALGVAIGSANTERYDNSVMYQTPQWAGFQAGAGYSFSADDTKTAQTGFATADNTRAITTGLRYNGGPLALVLTFDKLNGSNQLPSSLRDANPSMWALGFAYDFEVIKVTAAYGRAKDGWFVGQGIGNTEINSASYAGSNIFTPGFRANSYMLGASIPAGLAGQVLLSWRRVDPNDIDLAGKSGAKTMNAYSAGYTYALSKRTNLYAIATYIDQYAFQDDTKTLAVSTGIRHRF